MTQDSARESLLVVSAHAADFVWHAGGVTALYASRGHRATVVCLTYGERGESAKFWREGMTLPEIKIARRVEAEEAASALGGELHCFDANDYPLDETPELLYRTRQALPGGAADTGDHTHGDRSLQHGPRDGEPASGEGADHRASPGLRP